MDKGIAAVPNEKYRALIWNSPIFHYSDIFVWAEKTYGISLVMDSLSYNALPFIDTSDRETMLRDLGRVMMAGPMARHSHGPVEYFFDDIFQAYEQFNIDMIWVAAQIGCKNTMALNGILREKCREKGIPLLILDFDLIDPRIVSHEGITKQIENFMENVMKAERIG